LRLGGSASRFKDICLRLDILPIARGLPEIEGRSVTAKMQLAASSCFSAKLPIAAELLLPIAAELLPLTTTSFPALPTAVSSGDGGLPAVHKKGFAGVPGHDTGL
jgi:hypothetical protein